VNCYEIFDFLVIFIILLIDYKYPKEEKYVVGRYSFLEVFLRQIECVEGEFI